MNPNPTSRSPHASLPPRRNAGFTLAELLVVVAIVLVLVAIAVPLFTGGLENAKEAACAANRRSLKVIVTDTYLLDQTRDPQRIFEDGAVSLGGTAGGEDLCPSGGTLRLEKSATVEGAFNIKCSVHGLGIDEDLYIDVTTSYNGKWHEQFDPDGNKINSDPKLREVYAKSRGINAWPKLQGTDGPWYLQFKSYGNSSDTTFLYAGNDPNPTSTNPWNARYICDSTGLVGTPGQWYELPKTTNLGTSGEEALKGWLTAEGVKPVSLVGDTFQPAS